jgi:amidophosphoribosyltransferase
MLLQEQFVRKGCFLLFEEKFVSYNRTEEQICEYIGADLLVYQDLEDLIEAVKRKNDHKFSKPHCAYFNGDYPTKDVTEEILAEIEDIRKKERQEDKLKKQLELN